MPPPPPHQGSPLQARAYPPCSLVFAHPATPLAPPHPAGLAHSRLKTQPSTGTQKRAFIGQERKNRKVKRSLWVSHSKPPAANPPRSSAAPQQPQRRVTGGCAARCNPLPSPQRSKDVPPPFVTGSRTHSRRGARPLFEEGEPQGVRWPWWSVIPGRLREICLSRGKAPGLEPPTHPEQLEESLGQFLFIFIKKKQIWVGEAVLLPAPGCQQHPNFTGQGGIQKLVPAGHGAA